jgi:hypothetical protein
MRPAYGKSVAKYRRQISRTSQPAAQLVRNQTAKSVVRSQHRIPFSALAQMAFPEGTAINLAILTHIDLRTAQRWLANDTEPPAAALGIVLEEIMRRLHQR